MQQKKCSICEQDKPISEFSPDKDAKFGVACYCKVCTREYDRKRRQQPRWRLRGIWKAMIYRCCSVKDAGYHRYGGRGIIVCDEWLSDFEVFFQWCISHGWAVNLQLDRRDNDGPYAPWNCRFVTRSKNLRNIRAYGRSKYIGVYFHKSAQKWAACCRTDSKTKHLGLFLSEEEAARARDTYAVPLGFRPNFSEK